MRVIVSLAFVTQSSRENWPLSDKNDQPFAGNTPGNRHEMSL